MIDSLSRYNYLDDDFFKKDVYGIKIVEKAPEEKIGPIKNFFTNHPTSIIVSSVQLYLILIMLLIKTSPELILFAGVMLAGYITGGIAVMIDNSNNQIHRK